MAKELLPPAPSNKPAHDLFAPEQPDDPILSYDDIAWISVTRTAPAKENAGKSFAAGDLPDPDALRTRFGGGSYTVQARDQQRRVLAGGTRYYTFAGKPKPMDGSEPEAAAPAAPTIVTREQPAIDLTPLAQAIVESGKQTTQMMMAMMQQQTQVIQALMHRPVAPAPDDSKLLDAYTKGIELGMAQGQTLLDVHLQNQANKPEPSAAGELSETIDAIGKAVAIAGQVSGKKKAANE